MDFLRWNRYRRVIANRCKRPGWYQYRRGCGIVFVATPTVASCFGGDPFVRLWCICRRASHVGTSSSGRRAERAIRQALQQADIDVQALSYINAHGTATLLNDAMEAMTLSRVGASGVPLSSSKALTGHTLGAAGALEAALCWLMLSEHNVEQALIPQIIATEPDRYCQL